MGYVLKVHELASKEYASAYLWYKGIQIELTEKFRKAVETKI